MKFITGHSKCLNSLPTEMSQMNIIFKKIAPLLLMGFHSCLTEKLKTHHRGTTKGGHSQKSGMLIAGATKRGWRRAG